MLMSRVVKPGNKIESLQENPWNSATMLVFRNEVRTIINNLSVFEHSTRSNQSPIVIVANDQVRRHDIDNAEIRRFLLCLPDNKTEGLLGYLPIVPNMPVLITHNVATELHISNGSIGRLVKVVYEDEAQSYDATAISNPTFPSNTVYVRKPLYALVQLSQCKLASALPDLQPTCIPIVPEQKTIKVDLKSMLSSAQKRLLQNKTTITITRCQLPLIPAYALTTHKCQGKTLESGVIDIVPPPYSKPDLAQTYVPVSQFTSLEAMAILRPFPRSFLNQKPHPDMKAECSDCSQSIQLIEYLQQGNQSKYKNDMFARRPLGTIHQIQRENTSLFKDTRQHLDNLKKNSTWLNIRNIHLKIASFKCAEACIHKQKFSDYFQKMIHHLSVPIAHPKAILAATVHE